MLIRLIIILTFLISPVRTNAISSQAAPLDQVNDLTNFTLLIPQKAIGNWCLEIKEPDPIDESKPITLVRLHYLDLTGQEYMFGIEQHKAFGYKSKRVETDIDVRNNTSTSIVIEEDFNFDPRGKIINLNGVQARFIPWADGSTGGYLSWIQDGTYVEMDSGHLSENEMVRIAKSMRPLN